MRRIGTIPDGDHAERFSDYLLTRDIDNMIEQTAAGDFGVWVEHDDHLDRAKGELLSFLRNPDDPQYRNVAREAEKRRKQEEKKSKRLQGHFVDVRTSWGQAKQWAAPVTIALIIGCFIVSFMTGSVGIGAKRPQLLSEMLFLPVQATSGSWGDAIWLWWAFMKDGQVWRLITPIFIHFNILHILFDVFWLRDLGAMIETRRGSFRLLGIVLVSAVLSNFAQYLWDGPMFGGASGIDYALFGYIWIKGRYQPQLGMGLSRETIWIMFGWLVLCMTGLLGPVANAAHLIGLLVGSAIAYVPYLFRRVLRR
jgi:GlpG protein